MILTGDLFKADMLVYLQSYRQSSLFTSLYITGKVK